MRQGGDFADLPRVHREAIEPLQPVPLHPARRPADAAGEDVGRAAQRIPVLSAFTRSALFTTARNSGSRAAVTTAEASAVTTRCGTPLWTNCVRSTTASELLTRLIGTSSTRTHSIGVTGGVGVR